jgi:putative RNA 2'-phosphotransferase
MNKDLVKQSKFLSLVLRHQPEKANLTMDSEGWVDVNELLKKCNLTKSVLDEIVATNDKKRFAYSSDGKQIRASQGHSIDIDLKLAPKDPPEYLYHGTANHFISSIMKDGLHKMKRQHVHLSQTKETAVKVGSRHGKPTVLKVKSQEMKKDGFEFFLSDNGVWLVDNVPVKYIEVEWSNT